MMPILGFGKALYPIPIKMPPKRYGRFRSYYTYINSFIIRHPEVQKPQKPYLEKRKRQLKENLNRLY